MSEATATLKALLTADTTDFIGGFDKALNKLVDFGGGISTVTDAITHLRTTFVAELAAITAAFAATTYHASGLEKEILDVTTLVDTSKDSYKEFNDNILRAGAILKQNPAPLAAAEYQVLSAGIDDVNESFEVLITSGKMAKAGKGTTFEAVDLLTTAINSYGKEVSDVLELSDQFIRTVQLGKTTIGEQAASFGRVGKFAKEAGMELVELNATTATLTKNGIATAEAHTAIRGVLQSVIKPTKQAKDLAKELGIEFSTTALKSKGFLSFLEDIKNKTNNNSEALSTLFGNVQGLTAVLSLSGKTLKDYVEILDDLKNSAGETEKAFQKTLQPIKVFLANLKLISLEIGTRLLPLLNGVLTPINNLLDVLLKAPAALKDTAMWVGIIAAVLMPFRYILLILGTFGTRLAAIIPGILAAIRWVIPWLLRAIPLVARFIGLTNPIGWAILGIILLVQALRHNIFGLVTAVKEIWEAGTKATNEIWNAIFPLNDSIQTVKETLAIAWSEGKVILRAIVEVLKDYVAQAVEDIKELIVRTKIIIIAAIRFIKQEVIKLKDTILKALNSISIGINVAKRFFIQTFSAIIGYGGLVKKVIEEIRKELNLLIKSLMVAMQLLKNHPMFGWMAKGALFIGDVIKKYQELKKEIEAQVEAQKETEDNQNDINDALDGTADRLKQNSRFWMNWAREINEGLKNRARRLNELTQKQPNYGGTLMGGVASNRSSGLYSRSTTYHFELDGEHYILPGPEEGFTDFERRQANKMAEELHRRRKRKR